MKTIAVFALLVSSSALAADAPNVAPVTVESQPPCTGECATVSLQVQDQCVWARNDMPSPVVLVLTLASGATMQFMLKSGKSATPANAPYYNAYCDGIEKTQRLISEHEKGRTIITGPDPMAQQLQKCHADEMAVRAANLKKDEYYDLGSRVVRRKSSLGLGGSFMSTETYPVYWQRLKNGGACLAALHEVKAYNAATSQTIGSWIVSTADGVVKAVLAPSAIASLAAGAAIATAQLQLEYRRGSLFENSGIFVTSHLGGMFPPSYTFDVLADGKDVGQFHGNETFVATGDLRAIFGADLAGLAPVRKLSVVTNSPPTGTTTVFAADLQQTAAALTAMKAFADAM